VTGAATRSRWLELLAAREAARRGRELLDEKREILQRELTRRTASCRTAAGKASASLALARAALAEADVEIGEDAVDAAALAQRPVASAEIGEGRVLGVSVPAVRLHPQPFRIDWAPGGTSESLDRAAAAFAETLPLLAQLAQAELAVRNFTRALARTNRRLNALELIVLPGVTREIKEVAAALEEDERDEAMQRKRWLEAKKNRQIDSAAS
jgi:V/A-type H+/Na+-transporting ATPase subunit D